jgi:hypothetical protein
VYIVVLILNGNMDSVTAPYLRRTSADNSRPHPGAPAVPPSSMALCAPRFRTDRRSNTRGLRDRVRVERATERPSTTDTVATVAAETGFAFESSLAAAFTRRYGVAVGRWRPLRR